MLPIVTLFAPICVKISLFSAASDLILLFTTKSFPIITVPVPLPTVTEFAPTPVNISLFSVVSVIIFFYSVSRAALEDVDESIPMNHTKQNNQGIGGGY